MQIRIEKESDYETVEAMIQSAFRNQAMSDHKEHQLVHALRQEKHFEPLLSIVAEIDEEILGHVLLTEITIGEQHTTSLALAPVSVKPGFQNQGIGTDLIREALSTADELGYQSVIVLGDPNYYQRFGFKPASNWQIIPPFDVPDSYFMALELKSKALENVSGEVHYSAPFNVN